MQLLGLVKSANLEHGDASAGRGACQIPGGAEGYWDAPAAESFRSAGMSSQNTPKDVSLWNIAEGGIPDALVKLCLVVAPKQTAISIEV